MQEVRTNEGKGENDDEIEGESESEGEGEIGTWQVLMVLVGIGQSGDLCGLFLFDSF